MTRKQGLKEITEMYRLIKVVTWWIYDAAEVTGNKELRNKVLGGYLGTAGTSSIVAYPTRIRALSVIEIKNLLSKAEELLKKLDIVLEIELSAIK